MSSLPVLKTAPITVPPLECVAMAAEGATQRHGVYILFLPGANHGAWYFARMQQAADAQNKPPAHDPCPMRTCRSRTQLAASAGFRSVAVTFDHQGGAADTSFYCQQIAHVVCEQAGRRAPSGAMPWAPCCCRCYTGAVPHTRAAAARPEGRLGVVAGLSLACDVRQL